MVKNMLDGFLTPSDLGKACDASALDTKWEPLIKALECELFSILNIQISMHAYIQLNYIILK